MITFLDEKDVEHGAQATIKLTNAVNGERSLTGEIVTGDYVVGHIERGWRLRIDDDYFVVTYAKPVDEGKSATVTFDAVHQFFWDFDKSSLHSQLADGSHTFEAYLQFVFADSGYSYTTDPLIKVSAFEKQSFGYKSRLSLFNDIIKSTGIEFQVNGKVVRLLQKVGTDLSTVVRKNFNLNELTIEKNISDFVTYQKGFGAWKDSEDHSKGRLEVEYKSPLADIYGILEAEPLVDERYTKESSLLAVLKGAVDDSYSISVKLDIEDLTRAGYKYTQPVAGDYIMAINETLDFQEKIRIVSFTSSYDVSGQLIEHTVTCNDIGSVKRQSASYSVARKQASSAASSAQNALEVANHALVSADGKNRNYYGTDYPKDSPKGTLHAGDLLFLTAGDIVKQYRWNGADWEYVTGEDFAKNLNDKIQEQFADIDQKLTNQSTTHDKAVAEVLEKANAAQTLATEAKNISSQAKSDAITEANRLVELSKTALTDQIKSVDVKVDDVANQIAAKVSQTDYDKLTGRMTNAETKLVTQAGQIAERLTRTEINSLVDNKGYQTASQVQQIVTKSADTLTQTISQVESKIPTNVGGRNYALGTSNGYFGGYGKISTLSTEAKGWSTSQKLYLTFDYVATETVKGFRVNRVVEYNDGTSWQWNNTTDISKNGKEYIDTSAVKSGTYSGVWRWEPFVNNKTADKIKEIYLNLNLEDGSSGNVTIKRLRVNTGTVSYDWSPAPEDLATVAAFNKVQETVTSHTQTIMEHTSAISQVVQTAQGLVSRVADLTASGNLVYDPTNYSKYREREPNSNLVMTGTAEYKLLRITQSGRTSNGWRGFQMPLHSQKFVAGEKLSYRVNLWVDVLPDAKIGFEIKAGSSIGGVTIQPTRTGPAQIFTGTFTISKTVTKTEDFGLHVWLEKNGTVAFGQLSIVRGEQPPQSFVDSTSSMQLATDTQVSQLAGAWSVRNLNSAGDILSQANLSSSQFLLEAAKIRLKGQTLADEITAIDGKFNKLFVADGTFGKLNANIIGAEAISGGQIKFDQAFFDKMTANEAYLKQLFAKNAFITQVQSVTVSAAKIIGGIMAATNGAMKIDMNNGQALFYTDSAALKRVLSGYPTQFVKFATGKVDGVGSAGVTVIGSNRYGTESSNDGGFVGIRAWNSNKIDSLDLVGDTISMVASAYQSPQGFSINTWNNGGSPKIATLGSNAQKRDARIEIGDVYLYYNYNGNVVSLKQVLDNIFKNFQSLNAATAFNGQSYYSWWN